MGEALSDETLSKREELCLSSPRAEAASVDHQHLINDISLCIVVAWVLAVLAKLFRQPLIIAYLGAGLLVGPVGFGWIQEQASISTISELGLIFLLFMIGLEIDLKKILSAGRAIILTSVVQIVGGCLLGIALFKLAGFPLGKGRLDALYLAVSAALSSTVIIVKILHDKQELDTLAGRITLGVLVMQDLFAILFIAVQPDLKHPALGAILLSLGKVGVLVAAALAASRYALPPLFRAVARLPELVLVGALAWCFLICGLALALDLSREMGALIAGVAISTFPYTLDVTAKVTTLRDFFLTLFFVALGMTIPRPDWQVIAWALLFSGFLVASRLATVFLPLHLMRSGHRASFLPAVNLCQVSEFSLVIVALGYSAQHVGLLTKGIVAYAFVFLAIGASYAIYISDPLVRQAGAWLRRAGLRDLDEINGQGESGQRQPAKPIFFLGFFWTASSLLEELAREKPALLQDIAVIDFNPNVNEELRRRGVAVTYGDISQRETLLHAGVAQAEIILCTIPNALLKGTNNLRLVQQLREINPAAKIIAHAESFGEISMLYAAGADYVSVPRLVEAMVLRDVISAARNNRLETKRAELDRELINRAEVVP